MNCWRSIKNSIKNNNERGGDWLILEFRNTFEPYGTKLVLKQRPVDWCDTILFKMLLKLLVLFHVDELYADFLPSFLDEVVTRW